MIKPVGSDELNPLFVYDPSEHDKLSAEAESLPSVVISSQAAGNAVMMGGGYFNPLKGFMNVADAMGAAETAANIDRTARAPGGARFAFHPATPSR